MNLPIHHCAHPLCSTLVTDWNAVTCPPGVTCCEACAWEEACSDCAWDIPTAVNEVRRMRDEPIYEPPRIPRPRQPDHDDSALDHDEHGRPTTNAAPGWRNRRKQA